MEMLQIERELAGPEGREALMKYDGQLLALAGRLKQALDSGLAPDEFAKCSSLSEAVTIARKLLRLQIQ